MINTETTKFRILTIFITLSVTLFVLGRNISPLSTGMFTFHDETQAARVQEFTYNLQQGHIPPRIAPHFSFGMGYPMFNFYAPFPYWVTSFFDLIGFNEAASLKLSFLLALLIAFIGMLMFLNTYTDFIPSLVGAVVYVASPYIAVEIFVRGNLAELWFFALLPLALYFLKTHSKRKLVFTTLILSFLFTSHNVLSLVSVVIVVIYSFLLDKKLLNILSVFLGLLTSSYFLLPAIAEINMVYASQVATKTNYADHFLCLKQLWSSPWGFAGSAPGCDLDGMSFMLGKSNILIGLTGLGILVFEFFHKKSKVNSQVIFVALLSIASLFMVTSASQFIWKLTESISSLFQFPWRFLIFILFGIAFLAGFPLNLIPNKYKLIISLLFISAILYGNHEYFYGHYLSQSEYEHTYLSENYIHNAVAYKVAEYVPVSVNYHYWRSIEGSSNVVNKETPVVEKSGQEMLLLKNEPFYKLFMSKAEDKKIVANIHYAPYWQLTVNNKQFFPASFDKLGRPTIPVSNIDFDSIAIQYKQTPLEKLANLITVFTILGLFLWTFRQFQPSWKIIKIKKV